VALPAAERRAVGVLARRADAPAGDAGRATRRSPTGPLAGGASGTDGDPDGARYRKHYSFCRIGFLTSVVPPVAMGALCYWRPLNDRAGFSFTRLGWPWGANENGNSLLATHSGRRAPRREFPCLRFTRAFASPSRRGSASSCAAVVSPPSASAT